MTYNSIALVDLSYLFRRRWHAQTANAEVNEAASGVLRELAAIRDSVDHVILCADSPPYWRSDVDPNYKGNREKPSDGCVAQMRWLKERVDADGYQVAKAPTFEADDVIATLAAQLEESCSDVRIIGCDKDLAQCVTERVRMFVPAVGDREEHVLGPDEVSQKFGVPPAVIVEYLALIGDTSDNVPGCPGVGPKTAVTLLQKNGFLIEKLLENLAEDMAAEAPLSAKEKAVLDNAKQIQLSRELVQLRRDVPLELVELLKRKEPKPLAEKSEPPAPEKEDVEEEVESEVVEVATSPGIVSTRPSSTGHQWNIQLQPRGLKGVDWIARTAWNSRRYSRLNNEETLVMAIMRGRELGIPCTTALDSFHVVEDKLYPSAQLIIGMAQSHPECIYFMCTDSSPTSATWECLRKGWPKPMSRTYTIKQAEAAGLLEPSRRGHPSNYVKHPEDMLSKACGAKLARYGFADKLLGLVAYEELAEKHEDAA